ncbi:MAG: CaiB/BaiF CoA-transferase family protein [Gammaproteobacteria bacterium]|nr:CaiB/BaiF CoA-transferase family protein [Gammaproteobacteria bacterium]
MGPLEGMKIIELAGIGPGPFCGMMLSDMGADVIRIDRIANAPRRPFEILARNRRSIAVDLKRPEGIELVLKLCEGADGLFEGFRPGVTERLGLGPDDCMERNPQLVYGRMTGWGQEGPIAGAAGHDINYIALAGALHGIGFAGDRPVPPLNLVGDFGGGGMLLAFGMVCGMLEASRSGQGQVIDAAMIDGTAALMAMFYGMKAAGVWKDERGVNLLDTGSHFYNTFETSDGKHICIGSIEPQFYAELLERAALDADTFGEQMNPERWPQQTEALAQVFKQKTRDEWCEIMEGTDVCFAPVLSLSEAPNHPHNVARGTFETHDGLVQPAPAPRFSRTRGEIRNNARAPGEDGREVLQDFGFSSEEVTALEASSVIGGP